MEHNFDSEDEFEGWLIWFKWKRKSELYSMSRRLDYIKKTSVRSMITVLSSILLEI